MRDFTNDLLTRMNARDMSNSALAEAAGVTPAYITKVLRGSENFTLETMTKLSMAVGGKLRVHIADKAAQTYWTDSSSIPAPVAQERANNALNVLAFGPVAQTFRRASIDRMLPEPVTQVVGL